MKPKHKWKLERSCEAICMYGMGQHFYLLIYMFLTLYTIIHGNMIGDWDAKPLKFCFFVYLHLTFKKAKLALNTAGKKLCKLPMCAN